MTDRSDEEEGGLLRVLTPQTAALVLAVGTVVLALVAGLVAGVQAGLLAVLSGTLLGSILLVWHSLRTLAGDAEVDPALDGRAAVRAPSALAERRRRALRAIKDIEQEHAVGKLDDADFAALDAEYREKAKEVIREMDASLEPFREKAEALATAHLAKRTKPALSAEPKVCAACETPNDEDAEFCKKCGARLTKEQP